MKNFNEFNEGLQPLNNITSSSKVFSIIVDMQF